MFRVFPPINDYHPFYFPRMVDDRPGYFPRRPVISHGA
jgi:hypothetical protein